MKKSILILGLFCIALPLIAQSEEETAEADTLWKVSGVTSLNLSQLALYNWSAGGENNIAGNALFKLSPDYDDGTLNWDNDLTLGFGLVKQGDNPSKKSDDQIQLSSKFGYKASKNWFYSALVDFSTQFAIGYEDPDLQEVKISNFMAPGYLNLALGMDYKPTKNLSLMISPVSSKITFVLDDDLSAAGSFGLDPGKKTRGEFGANIKFAYKREVLKNVLVDTKLGLFSNYLQNPQYVDVNWDLLITLKVNDYISASILTQLIYDYDIKFGPDLDEDRVQFKELFGLGLTYNF
jgi:hypothetical protein